MQTEVVNKVSDNGVRRPFGSEKDIDVGSASRDHIPVDR